MKKTLILAGVALAVLTMSGCVDPQTQAQYAAQERASARSAYVPQNSLDFENYDRRQRLSDNPSTIVWCTAVFPQPGLKPITMPIVGKLTSGGKRPFSSDPGPDGMYGSSGEYRYGFTPGGNMADFYGIATFCTTEPTVWQRDNTDIVVTVDPRLAAAGRAAEVHVKNAGAKGSANADAVITAAAQ